MDTGSDEIPAFDRVEVAAMAALVLATLVKASASRADDGFLVPSLAYLGLSAALMLRTPRRPAARRAGVGALAALGVISMAASHNETLLMTMSLLPVAALFEGMGAAVAIAVALAVATAAVSWASGDPARDQVQWVASVIGGDLFLLAFSRLMVRERRARVALRRQSALAQELSAAAERSRIAADLHDGLGHHLTAALIQIEAARAVGRDGAPTHIERARALILGATREVRAAVSASHPPTSARTFLGALDDLVRDNQHAGIDTRLVCEEPWPGLPPAVEYALWRGVQEALTNVRRHAGAQRATVTLTSTPSERRVTIADDGVGAAAVREGVGLRAMRERMEASGGSARFDAEPGRGATVTLRVPR